MGAHLDADPAIGPAVHGQLRGQPEPISARRIAAEHRHHDRGRLHPDWTLGPNRFPTQAQNPYLKFDSFAYPAAFTPGTLGRNTFEGPGLLWTQLSLAKWWEIKERVRFQIRLDGNNFPFAQPNFTNPGSSYNTNNAAAFGRGFGTRGSFSDVGTSNPHMLVVLRMQF